MKEKIENLKKELKIILDDKYTIVDYLTDIWNSKYCGIKERHEALEMLKYLKEEMNK